MKHRNFKQSLTTPEKERTELREQKCSGMQTTEIDFSKLHRIPLPIQTKCPPHDFSMAMTPLILSACEPFLSLLLLRHPSLACSDLDQLSSPWWPTWYAILPCGSGSPSGYCLLLLFTLLCALWFSPGPAWHDIWSCFSLVLASAVDLFFHP